MSHDNVRRYHWLHLVWFRLPCNRDGPNQVLGTTSTLKTANRMSGATLSPRLGQALVGVMSSHESWQSWSSQGAASNIPISTLAGVANSNIVENYGGNHASPDFEIPRAIRPSYWSGTYQRNMSEIPREWMHIYINFEVRCRSSAQWPCNVT